MSSTQSFMAEIEERTQHLTRRNTEGVFDYDHYRAVARRERQLARAAFVTALIDAARRWLRTSVGRPPRLESAANSGTLGAGCCDNLTGTR